MQQHSGSGRDIVVRLAGMLFVLIVCLGLSTQVHAKGGVRAVVPGMNQTELQSVMGPPDYIQTNGTRQAWQYCPHFMERLLKRRGNFVVTVERLIAREDGDLFVTVWLTDGQVDHLRAYPVETMGSCDDYYAAFRWEDIIEGDFASGSGYEALLMMGKKKLNK